MINYKSYQNTVIIDNVDLMRLLNTYETPLYCISYSKLHDNIMEFKKSFLNKYLNVKVNYACKANFCKGIAQIMQYNGLGLDVVSYNELWIAKEAGFNLNNIEYNGNNKTYKDIDMAIFDGIGYIICDNEYELDIIQMVSYKYGKTQKILFRITPEVGSGSHAHINTGQKDSKFGIPIVNNIFFQVFDKALKLSNIEVVGIHFHIGSQLVDIKPYLDALDTVLNIIDDLYKKYEYNLEILNIGGGFGINYTIKDNAPNLDYYFEPIMVKITEFFNIIGYERPLIVVEPGRYLIGEAGFTLYKVGSIKEIPEVRKYVSIDGGMCDNIRPSLYQAKYHAIVVNKAQQVNEEVITLAGNCCESGDILIYDISLPKLDINDVICVFSTGAYNYSMASNYNKNTIPATVLLNNGQITTLIKSQTREQLVQNDLDIDFFV